MGFWWSMLICNLLIPCIMLFVGFHWQTKPPQKINHFYGYRTAMSMKNADTWQFAHTYCGALWKKVGTVLLIITILLMLPLIRQPIQIVSIISCILCVIQIVVLITPIIQVERALKQNFDSQGNRKESPPE